MTLIPSNVFRNLVLAKLKKNLTTHIIIIYHIYIYTECFTKYAHSIFPIIIMHLLKF